MSCWNTCHRCLKDMEDCECFSSRAKKKVYIEMDRGLIESIIVSKDLKDVDFIVIDYSCEHDYEEAEICNGSKAYVNRGKANGVLKTKQFKFEKC